MKPLIQILVLVPALLFFSGPYADDQDQSDATQDRIAAIRLKPVVSNSKQTQYVSCWNKKNKLIGSRLVRTPVLTSMDGLHRAYVEVAATATYTGDLCENTSLQVGSGDSARIYVKNCEMRIQLSALGSRTSVSVSAVAKEGAIKQHSARSVVERIKRYPSPRNSLIGWHLT